MAQRDIHGQLVAPAPCPDLAPGLTRRGFSMALTKCFTCGINACTLHSRAGGFPLPALTERQLTMTKLDRQEFDRRRDALDHYAKLALDHCLMYGLTSKSKWLAEQRAKGTDQ